MTRSIRTIHYWWGARSRWFQTFVVFGFLTMPALIGLRSYLTAEETKPDDPLQDEIQPEPGGRLFICGGGPLPDPVRKRFLHLAGGSHAKVIIIPGHPSSDPQKLLDPWRSSGARDIEMLRADSREVANDPDFAGKLADAMGIWFSGGQQSYLSRTYVGTLVEKQVRELLARGGVVGGTSAGAAVMSRVMIARGQDTPVLGQGFGFLPGAVIDQHFLKRNRMNRLLEVVGDHPDLIGLGVDERTALEIRLRDLRMDVVGDSYVMACMCQRRNGPPEVEVLRPGNTTFFEALKEEVPVATMVGGL